MLERLGDERLSVDYAGDGAGALVEAVAAAQRDGSVGVLVWNATLDQSKAAGHAPLDRAVDLEVTGLAPGATYVVTEERVDAEHSNLAATWEGMREPDQAWPEEHQWRELHEADRLEHLAPPRELRADAEGVLRVATTLPMPSLSLIGVAPA